VQEPPFFVWLVHVDRLLRSRIDMTSSTVSSLESLMSFIDSFAGQNPYSVPFKEKLVFPGSSEFQALRTIAHDLDRFDSRHFDGPLAQVDFDHSMRLHRTFDRFLDVLGTPKPLHVEGHDPDFDEENQHFSGKSADARPGVPVPADLDTRKAIDAAVTLFEQKLDRIDPSAPVERRVPTYESDNPIDFNLAILRPQVFKALSDEMENIFSPAARAAVRFTMVDGLMTVLSHAGRTDHLSYSNEQETRADRPVYRAFMQANDSYDDFSFMKDGEQTSLLKGKGVFYVPELALAFAKNDDGNFLATYEFGNTIDTFKPGSREFAQLEKLVSLSDRIVEKTGVDTPESRKIYAEEIIDQLVGAATHGHTKPATHATLYVWPWVAKNILELDGPPRSLDTESAMFDSAVLLKPALAIATDKGLVRDLEVIRATAEAASGEKPLKLQIDLAVAKDIIREAPLHNLDDLRTGLHSQNTLNASILHQLAEDRQAAAKKGVRKDHEMSGR
jgi:hypothetical protein